MPTNRRQFLAFLGAATAAPALLAATTGSASAAPTAAGPVTGEAECLADLVGSGAVSRGDLVAR